jgi:hypothetical protein
MGSLEETGIDGYEEFQQLIGEESYEDEQLSALKDFYTEKSEEYDLREEVIDELERSSGGLKDIQLLSLLSENEGCGGERIEEDCDVGSPTYRV